jgi:hypothetical protein
VGVAVLLGIWDAGLLWDGAIRELPTPGNLDLVNVARLFYTFLRVLILCTKSSKDLPTPYALEIFVGVHSGIQYPLCVSTFFLHKLH